MNKYKKAKFKVITTIEYEDLKNKVVKHHSLPEEKEGYIIGTFYKYTGKYYRGCPNPGMFGEDYDPPSLENKKRINFYKILTGFNEIYEVAVDQVTVLEEN